MNDTYDVTDRSRSVGKNEGGAEEVIIVHSTYLSIGNCPRSHNFQGKTLGKTSSRSGVVLFTVL